MPPSEFGEVRPPSGQHSAQQELRATWLLTSYRRSLTCRSTSPIPAHAHASCESEQRGQWHLSLIEMRGGWHCVGLTNGASAARALAAAAARPQDQYKARRLPQIERALASCMRWLDRSTLPTVTFAHHAGPSWELAIIRPDQHQAGLGALFIRQGCQVPSHVHREGASPFADSPKAEHM